jgi:alkylhydroperoxidase family enzyme
VRRGATEDLVAKLADYERSDLPERTKAALRLADRLTAERPRIDAE